jgi:hypothetical protein
MKKQFTIVLLAPKPNSSSSAETIDDVEVCFCVLIANAKTNCK